MFIDLTEKELGILIEHALYDISDFTPVKKEGLSSEQYGEMEKIVSRLNYLLSEMTLHLAREEV